MKVPITLFCHFKNVLALSLLADVYVCQGKTLCGSRSVYIYVLTENLPLWYQSLFFTCKCCKCMFVHCMRIAYLEPNLWLKNPIFDKNEIVARKVWFVFSGQVLASHISQALNQASVLKAMLSTAMLTNTIYIPEVTNMRLAKELRAAREAFRRDQQSWTFFVWCAWVFITLLCCLFLLMNNFVVF